MFKVIMRLRRHKDDLLFIAACLAGIVAITLTAGGCAQIEKMTGPLTGDNPLAIETADTIGYGIGILAAKNPRLQAKVETYYSQIETGGLMPAAVNGILDALGTEGQEYQFFAYKLTRVLTRAGGVFEGGRVVDLAPIDPLLLDAAKQAYLLAGNAAKKK